MLPQGGLRFYCISSCYAIYMNNKDEAAAYLRLRETVEPPLRAGELNDEEREGELNEEERDGEP